MKKTTRKTAGDTKHKYIRETTRISRILNDHILQAKKTFQHQTSYKIWRRLGINTFGFIAIPIRMIKHFQPSMNTQFIHRHVAIQQLQKFRTVTYTKLHRNVPIPKRKENEVILHSHGIRTIIREKSFSIEKPKQHKELSYTYTNRKRTIITDTRHSMSSEDPTTYRVMNINTWFLKKEFYDLADMLLHPHSLQPEVKIAKVHIRRCGKARPGNHGYYYYYYYYIVVGSIV